ncbi:MAG: His-Xaa-Ser system radical SAM maturase HxsC [Methylophilaceae bacterium]|nr:His-Xaa-Ser system radical SAM maturase HxsC [Methylophilaceae bacterium]
MLKLGGKIIHIENGFRNNSKIFSISTNPLLPNVLKAQKAYLVKGSDVPAGFSHYLVFNSHSDVNLPENSNYSLLGEEFSYLDNDDIIKLASDKLNIKVLFRASSPHNSVLVTEQCNHYCLMCSQPPKNIDDSWILDEIEEMIPLIPKDTVEIGFTGGEPTLYGERFLNLLNLTKNYLPRTAIHILSNGRTFKDRSFTDKYAVINHHDMMVGIPIYSDDPTQHDYIVQAKGAFDDTIQGILNLKRLNQKVEIRVVIHKQSIDRLESLCEFIARNLLFVDHVALMGLEMMGFTRANLDKLWIDPYDYKDNLSNAVSILAKAGMNVSVYNHQLCLINQDIMPYYRKSISDWKNEFAPECNSCSKVDDCGGFFASGIQYGYSKNLTAFN